MQAVSAMLLLYPDLLVTGAYKVVFWAQAQLGLLLSLVAMTLLVPQLITRDRGSQALTIYLARPLTSQDYLLGKFGIIIGVLLMLWTGPLVVGWLVAVSAGWWWGGWWLLGGLVVGMAATLAADSDASS